MAGLGDIASVRCLASQLCTAWRVTPYRPATSVTGAPELTSMTAWQRCSTTDNSTSAIPASRTHDARKRHATEAPITAPVNHLVGLPCQASTGTGHLPGTLVGEKFPYVFTGAQSAPD